MSRVIALRRLADEIASTSALKAIEQGLLTCTVVDRSA